MAFPITETEGTWIANLLGTTGPHRVAPGLPPDYFDQALQAVASGVDAEGDFLRAIEDAEPDTLLERLRALSDDDRAVLLEFVEEVLSINGHTAIRDAQTLAVTMTYDQRAALGAQREGQAEALRQMAEIHGSAGVWQLVACWRSAQRGHDVAALEIAYEAALAPSVVEAVGIDDKALGAVHTLVEVAEIYAAGCKIDAELRRLGIASPPPPQPAAGVR